MALQEPVLAAELAAAEAAFANDALDLLCALVAGRLAVAFLKLARGLSPRHAAAQG